MWTALPFRRPLDIAVLVSLVLVGWACAASESDTGLNVGSGGTSPSAAGGASSTGATTGGGGATGSIIDEPSAGTGSGTEPSYDGKLTGFVRDFHEAFPDMEMHGKFTNDPYQLETGIVADVLGEDRKPVYAGDPVKGTAMTTGKANFDMWFRDVAGTNLGRELTLEFTDPDGDGVWTYDNGGQPFFPIDDELLGNEGNPHNFHFTFELHTTFSTRGGEVFTFEGDDDVWVFINNKLVVDIGGVHAATKRSVAIDELGIPKGSECTLDFFFAERHVYGSNFRIDTSLALRSVLIR